MNKKNKHLERVLSKKKHLFPFFLFCSVLLLFATLLLPSISFAEALPETRTFTVEVKDNRVSVKAIDISIKDILNEVAAKTGIKLKIFDEVPDKKVTVDVKDLPIYAISELLDRMGIKNYGVAYEKKTAKLWVYVVNDTGDLPDLIKDKTVVRRAKFESGKEINRVKGKEIVSKTDEKKGVTVRYVKDEILLKFHRGVTKKDIDEVLKKHKLLVSADTPLSSLGYIKATIPDGRDVQDVAKEIAKERQLKLPEPNYIQSVLTSSITSSSSQSGGNSIKVADPLYADQWYVTDTGFDKAWERTKSKEKIKVAVIDTGIQKEHPDLKGKTLKGYDFVNGDEDPSDDNGHGTFVSGIIAAAANELGIKGLYDFAQIIPVKVMDSNGLGTYEDAARGIIYAVDNGARVINLSIGGYGYSYLLRDAVDYALEKGCIVVAAAGNDGIEKEIYPAAYPDVMGVSALEYNGQVWGYSNSGRHIDVSAPGVNIISTGINGEYAYASGTSASAPMVSALAAMLQSERPDISSTSIERLIKQSAKDLGEKGMDKVYGSGEINAPAALDQSVKPYHDVAVRRVYIEPMTFEKGKSTYIVAEIENIGTYSPEVCDVVLFEVVGKEKKEIGKAAGIVLLDKQKVVFEWKAEGVQANVKFEVEVFSNVDINISNNSKGTIGYFLKEGDGLYVLYPNKPPVHQWIALQAYNKLINSNAKYNEIGSYLDTNSNSNYYSLSFSPPADWAISKSSPGLSLSPLLEGTWEEDAANYGILAEYDYCDADTNCTSEWYQMLPVTTNGLGVDSFCSHFWDPAGGYNYGLFADNASSLMCGSTRNNSALTQANTWWNSALTSYALNTVDSKKYAYYYLGRVAHLIADMSVPAHVLNDDHPISENYENFTKDTTYDGTGNYRRITSSSANINIPTPTDSMYSTNGYDKKLTDLFNKLAETANNFDSDDVNGRSNKNGKGKFRLARNQLTSGKTVARVEYWDFTIFGNPDSPIPIHNGSPILIKYDGTENQNPSPDYDILQNSCEYAVYYYQSFYDHINLTDNGIRVFYTDGTDESFIILHKNALNDVFTEPLACIYQPELEASAIGYTAALFKLFWDTVQPHVDAFRVEQTTINVGNPVNISYKASANGGLKRAELWRTNDINGAPDPNWTKPDSTWPKTTILSGQTSYSGSFTDIPPSTGTYWYGLHVVDNAGNLNDEQNSKTDGSPGDFGPDKVEVRIPSDTTKPTISITSPSNGSTVSYTITISVSTYDANGINKVAYYIDNTSIPYNNAIAPYGYTWNTTTVTNGLHTIKAIAYDNSGNPSDPATINITVNNTTTVGNNAPNILTSLTQFKSDGTTSMNAGATTNERIIIMKGGVTDADSDPVSLDIEIKPVGVNFTGNHSSEYCPPVSYVASGNTVAVTCTGFTDGQYKWQARAKDNRNGYGVWTQAGYSDQNMADIVVAATTVVNTPPTVTLISPDGGQLLTVNTPYEINWTATNGTGVIQSYDILLSTDGGVTWPYIIQQLIAPASSYIWTPTITTTQARIKVAALDSNENYVNDISNGNFSIAAACSMPSVPNLYGIGLLSETGAYTINWSNVYGASSYTVQESTNSSFTSIVEYSASGPSLSVSGKTTNPYYYRVKANNSCGSSGWSNSEYITVNINQAPIMPYNPSPLDGSTNVTRQLSTLSWSGGDTDGTVEYAVQFGTNPDPGFSAGFGSITGTSYQLPSTLEPGTTYYWGVSARDNKGTRTDGPIWRFTTEYSYADLVPVSLSINGTVVPNAQVTLNLTVRNDGSFTAPGAQAFFYLSSISGGKEQKLNNSGTIIPQLAPGAQTTITQTVTLSNLKAGQSYIDAWIDTQNYFTEGNRNNNSLSYAINYIDANAPVISYLGLSGATKFRTAHSYSIVSTITDDIGVTTMDFYYSTDNGTNWTTIATGFIPGSHGYGNSYLWTIPSTAPLTDQLRIKMVAHDSSGNSSESTAGPYTIISGEAPTVTLLSPNGGEIWDLGTTHTITYNVSSSNGIEGMSLTVYWGNTATYITSSSTDKSGSYAWTIPNSSGYATTGAKIRIRVDDLNGNSSEDWSDGFFSIRDSSVPPPAPWTTPEMITSVPTGNLPYTTKGHGTPIVVSDKFGTIHMVYTYSQDDMSGMVNNTSPAWVIKQQILYKKLVNGTWSTPGLVYSLINNTDSSHRGYHVLSDIKLSVDNNGYPNVVWVDQVIGGITDLNQNDVYYTSYDGATWSTPINISDNIPGANTLTTLTWATKASLPVVKAYAASAVYNSKLYIFGGNQYLTNYVYDPSTNGWSQIADSPSNGVTEGGAAVINNKIYVVGSAMNYNELKIYDPAANSWTSGANIPTPRRLPSVATVNGKLYTIGGADGNLNPYSSVEEYDPATNTWSTKANMPTARWGTAVGVVNNLIYVFGGAVAGGNGTYAVEVYDPATDIWVSNGSSPTARRMAFGTVVNGRIYVIGGAYGNSYSNTVEEYDPSTNNWLTKTSMPTARMQAAGGTIGSDIYVVGGYDGTENVSVNEVVTLSTGGSATVSGTPIMSIDPSNNVHAVWLDGSSYNFDYTRNGEQNLYYRIKDNAGNWSQVTKLTNGGAWDPSFVSENGILHLAYQVGSRRIAYMKWDGTSWSSPEIVTTSADGLIDLTVRNNKPHMVWYYYDNADITHIRYEILYSHNDGSGWSQPELVSEQGYSRYPSVVVDSSDRPHVFYEDNKDGSRLLYRYKNSIDLAAPVQINLSSQYVADNSSSVAISPSDHIHAVWSSSYNGSSEIFYNHANIGDALNDSTEPTVTVLSPSSGESLSIGSTYNISWSASDNIGVSSIVIEYSTDGGAIFSPVSNNEANDGSFEWTVPNVSSDSVQIKITAMDMAGNPGSGLSGLFSVSDLSAPFVSVLTPNGGESIEAGNTYSVTWTASDNVGVSAIDISYSVDSGLNWLPIGTGLGNTGTYDWSLPYNVSNVCLVRITAFDAADLFAMDISNAVFTIKLSNTPPLTPYSPLPLDKESGVSLQKTLSWNGGDIDIGDSLTYTIYFGTNSNPPLTGAAQSTTSYNPGQLAGLTTYYWKIVSSDGKASTSSPIWSFTTGPEPISAPSNVTFTNVTSKELSLSWTDQANNETSYNVERKTGINGTYSVIAILGANVITYTDQGLNGNTTYIYRIRALNEATASPYTNEAMMVTANNVPGAPSSPLPSIADAGSSINTVISWLGGDADPSDTVTYDVYFGTSSNPPLISSGQTETFFNPGTLAFSKTYYWRVVGTDNHGSTTNGALWYFVTETPDIAPPTTTESPSGGLYNSTQSVTLYCSDGIGSGCDKIYYTTDGTTPTTASTVYTTPISISSTKTLKFFARDLAGNSEAMKTATYTIDTTAPIGAISINAGVTSTNSTSVTLTMSCTDANGCSQMQFSNDGTTWSIAETYSTSKSWSLSSGDGTKTVYVKFKDVAGNWSTAYSNAITLDTVAPDTTLTSQPANPTNAASLFSFASTEANSTFECNIDAGSYYTCTSPAEFTLLAEGTHTFSVRAKDQAGNTDTTPASYTWMIDKTSPDTTLTSQPANPTNAASLFSFASTEANSTFECNIDAGSYYTCTSPAEFTLLPEGTHTFSVRANDQAGNTDTTPASLTWTIDKSLPSGSISINDGAASTNSTTVSLTLSCTDASGCSEMQFSNDGATWSIAETYSTGKSWTLTSGDGTKTVYVKFKDVAGNWSTAYSDEITLDIILPVFSSTSPASGSIINTPNVGYTLSEPVSTGKITFTRTVGSPDPLPTHIYNFTPSDRTIGTHSVSTGLSLSDGSIYTISFEAMDAAGNASSVVQNTDITFDASSALVTIIVPPSDSVVNNADVNYLLSEQIFTGNIVYARTGGNTDAASPQRYYLIPDEMTFGEHTVETGLPLVDGAIYLVSIENITDKAGNLSNNVSNINVKYDATSVVISNTSPRSNSLVKNAAVGYTLSEQAASGNVTFTWTDGVSDPNSHVYIMTSSDLTSGVHTVDTLLPLVNGAVYTVSFDAIDLAGNPATTVSNGLVYYHPNNWYEEMEPVITYTGAWSNFTNPNLSGGAIKISSQTGAKAEFSFKGKGIKWIAAKEKRLGKAKVYIDGVLQTTVDLYSAIAKAKQTVYQKTWLSSGNHTIKIDVAGQKSFYATGYNVDVDAFEVTP